MARGGAQRGGAVGPRSACRYLTAPSGVSTRELSTVPPCRCGVYGVSLPIRHGPSPFRHRRPDGEGTVSREARPGVRDRSARHRDRDLPTSGALRSPHATGQVDDAGSAAPGAEDDVADVAARGRRQRARARADLVDLDLPPVVEVPDEVTRHDVLGRVEPVVVAVRVVVVIRVVVVVDVPAVAVQVVVDHQQRAAGGRRRRAASAIAAPSGV